MPACWIAINLTALTKCPRIAEPVQSINIWANWHRVSGLPGFLAAALGYGCCCRDGWSSPLSAHCQLILKYSIGQLFEQRRIADGTSEEIISKTLAVSWTMSMSSSINSDSVCEWSRTKSSEINCVLYVFMISFNAVNFAKVVCQNSCNAA